MRLGTLGPVTLLEAPSRRPLTPGQQVVLATLAVARPRPVSAARLADALWPGSPPDNPSAALRSQIARLRRLLPDGAIATDGSGYRLRGESVSVDVDEFEQAVAEARAAPPDRRAALLQSACALWRGTAFGEMADHPFLQAEAARLDELHASAVEDLAEALLDVGDLAGAICELQAHVAREPYRERPRALLMLALHRAGRTAEALEGYQSFRRRLGEELGLEPSATLVALEQEILTGDRPADTDVPPALAVTWTTTRRRRRVATGAFGRGLPLVVLPTYVGSMRDTLAGDDVLSSHFYRELAQRFRVLTFDRSGTGLTGGDHDGASLESAVDEAEDVLVASGVRPAPLVAMSAAGPVGLTLAARRPDLVTHLVLIGTFASGADTFRNTDATSAVSQLVRSHWGLGSRLIAGLWIPDASPEQLARTAAYQRGCASPEMAATYLEAMYGYDASGSVAEIRQPSLVVHYDGDRAVPFAAGTKLAAELPGAQLIPLSGGFHLPTPEDAPRIASLIDRFVSEDEPPRSPPTR